MLRNIRRRLSLMIYPEWLYEVPLKRRSPDSNDPFRTTRRAQLLKLADLFVAYHASTINGCITSARNSYGYYQPNRTADAIIRLKKNPALCPRISTHKIGCQWFSTHWPEGLDWPSDIPRPAPEKDAA